MTGHTIVTILAILAAAGSVMPPLVVAAYIIGYHRGRGARLPAVEEFSADGAFVLPLEAGRIFVTVAGGGPNSLGASK